MKVLIDELFQSQYVILRTLTHKERLDNTNGHIERDFVHNVEESSVFR